MPDPVITNKNKGESSVATTTASFGFTATAGRTLVLIVGADDYKTGNPSGWSVPTGGSQEVFLGFYVWYKVASGGETSVQYTIGSATTSAWIVFEIPDLETSSPLDVSAGSSAIATFENITTTLITPSTGRRFILGAVGMSCNSDTTGFGSWTNSFAELDDARTTAGATRDAIAVASKAMDGNGSTTVNTNCAVEPNGAVGASAGYITLSFKVSEGGGGGSTYVPSASPYNKIINVL